MKRLVYLHAKLLSFTSCCRANVMFANNECRVMCTDQDLWITMWMIRPTNGWYTCETDNSNTLKWHLNHTLTQLSWSSPSLYPNDLFTNPLTHVLLSSLTNMFSNIQTTEIPEMEPDCVKPTDRAPLRSMNQHRGSATLSYWNNTKYWLNHYQHYHFVMNHFQSSVQSTTRQEYHCCSKRSQVRSTPFLFYT